MKYPEANKKLFELRSSLLQEIDLLVAKLNDTYVDIYIPYSAGIKHINPSGSLGTYMPLNGQLKPLYISDLPTDSLVSLLEQLEKKHGK